jgi:hypothetical protein
MSVHHLPIYPVAGVCCFHLVVEILFTSILLCHLTPQASFVAGANPRWLTKIVDSANKHGWTWLHHLHVAFEAAERYDLSGAHSHFIKSVGLRPSNAQAHRGLAVMEADPSQRQVHFAAAWQAAVDVLPTDPSGTVLGLGQQWAQLTLLI